MKLFRWRRRTMTAVRLTRVRLSLERLEDRTVPSVTVGTNVAGLNYNDNSFALEPPDPITAAGPNQVVELVNVTMRIYDKSGNVLSTEPLQNFFAPLNPANLSDADVMFDNSISNGTGKPAGRFIIGAIDYNNSGASHFDFAVSNDADPRDGFGEMHQIDMSQGGLYFADYPRYGYNSDVYVYTFNMFDSTGSYFDHVEVLTIGKSSVLDNNNSTLTDYQVASPNSSDFTLTPAVMHGAAAGGPMYFVEGSNQGGSGSTVNVVTMTNELSNNPAFQTTTLSVPSYNAPPTAQEPNGYTITTNDSRILNAAWRNGELVASQTVGSGGVAQARWYQFSTTGSSPTLVQSGQITPGPGVSTYFPAVEIDANNDIGMTYMQSSSSQYVSMYVTGRTPSDPTGTMETPVEVAKGTDDYYDPYYGTRAGDYSGIAVDPNTGTSFWAASEYVPTGSYWNWATEVANFSLSSSVPTNSDHFAFTATPSSTTAGTAFSITVQALKPDNSVDKNYTGTVHFTSTDTGSGVALPGNYTFTAANQGQHTFNNAVTLVTTGKQTIIATDTSNSAITGSANVTVTPAAASKLVFGQQPSNTVAGTAISSPVTVKIEDQYGNVVNSSAGVSLAIGSNPGGGTLSGTTSVTASNGVATFSNLSIDKLGNGYTLTASSPSLQGATSNAFNITSNSSITFSSTDVPAPIYTAEETISYLTINQHVTIQSLKAQLNITYDNDSDLELDLISPNGTDVPLSWFEPTSSYGGNFNNTIFDDNASTPISQGTPPFSGSYRPETPLSAVARQDAYGTWQLVIQDWGYNLFDQGTLNSWSLTVQPASSSPPSPPPPPPSPPPPASSDHFVLSPNPISTTAGAPFSIAVTAEDSSGNVDSSYSGIVHFSTTDTGTGVVLPADTTLSNGTGTFNNVILVTAGNQTITATDASNSAITGSASVTVNSTSSGGVIVGTNVPGLNSGDPSAGYEPPDPIVAAGPDQVVELVNTTMRVYDKSGNVLSTETLPQFFAALNPVQLSDANVMYDDGSGRFIIGAIDFDSSGAWHFDFAVSNDSNPLDGFGEMHQIDMSQGGQYFADYPRYGYNADAYVYTFNMFDQFQNFSHVEVLTIDKSSVLDNNNTTLTDYQVASPNSSDFTLTPAVMHGAASGGPMYFVEDTGSSTGSGSSTVNVVTMTNELSNNPTFQTTTLSVPSYNTPPPAQEPNYATMTTNDSRILNAAWRNGELVASQTVGSSSVAQARWYQFNTNGSSPTLVQSGQIADTADSSGSTYFPAVEIDASGDIGMTYMQSSASEYVSMYVTGRTPSDPTGTMETPVEVAAGGSDYQGTRAGDYSGIAVDPNSGTSFWAASEYVPAFTGNNYWATEVANFSLSALSPPSPPPPPPSPPPPASSDHFVLSPNPISTAAGALFSITVTAEDSSGNVDSSYSGTVHFSTTDTGTGVVLPADTTLSNGTGTFNNVILVTAGNQTITATDASNSAITGSASVTVTPATASQLVFDQQPTDTAAGNPISPAVTVKVEDPYNNVVTNSSASVSLALAPAGVTLGGTTTVAAINGVATFSDLSINTPGNGYTLTASSPSLQGATSNAFNVTSNSSSDYFVFFASAAATTAGSPFSIYVTAFNANNQIDTGYRGTIHFSSTDKGAVLPADYTFTAGNQGQAIFNATLVTAGNQTITVTDTNNPSLTSTTSVGVYAADPAKLAFGQQPTTTAANTAISPAVTVLIEDQYGNVATYDNSDQVSLAIGANPGGGTLSGTATVTAINGVVTFSDLSINTPGNGYTLTANSGFLPTVTSNAFNITSNSSLTFSSTDVPAPIYTAEETISYLTINQHVTIQSLKAQLNITYDNDSDLELDLISPNGTDVPLSWFEPTSSYGGNFNNTIFDDNAPTPISQGTPSFSDPSGYRPETPLSAVARQDAYGTWQLVIQDWGYNLFDQGTLNSWSLIVQPTSPPQVSQALPAPGSHGTAASSPGRAASPPVVSDNPSPRQSDEGTVSPSSASFPYWLANASSFVLPPSGFANSVSSTVPPSTPAATNSFLALITRRTDTSTSGSSPAAGSDSAGLDGETQSELESAQQVVDAIFTDASWLNENWDNAL